MQLCASPRVAAPQAAAPAAWCPPAATYAGGMCAVKHLLPLLRLQPSAGSPRLCLECARVLHLVQSDCLQAQLMLVLFRAWTPMLKRLGKSVRPGGNAQAFGATLGLATAASGTPLQHAARAAAAGAGRRGASGPRAGVDLDRRRPDALAHRHSSPGLGRRLPGHSMARTSGPQHTPWEC